MADAPLVVVPYVTGDPEAARLIDAEARLLASIPDPANTTSVSAFREAALAAAFHFDEAPVAGILFASRWGGGGMMLT